MQDFPVFENERITHNRCIDTLRDIGYEAISSEEKCGTKETGSLGNLSVLRLKAFLSRRYRQDIVEATISEITKILTSSQSFKDKNKAFLSLLRYGVNVAGREGEQNQTVWLVDWLTAKNNQFAYATELYIKGKNANKRADLVCYVNGMAFAVIEFKRDCSDVMNGVDQLIGYQHPQACQDFFVTVQILIAGNNSQGIRYATTGSTADHFNLWVEDEERGMLPRYEKEKKLNNQLVNLLEHTRTLEFIHDFIMFDKDKKKIARHNQFFAVREIDRAYQEGRSGTIWHTQGSGKSMTVAFSIRRLLEKYPECRVLMLTDRIELNRQIVGLFTGVDGPVRDVVNIESGKELLEHLAGNTSLMASLVHKFGRAKEFIDTDGFIADIEVLKTGELKIPGNLLVIADECHRTQSGGLHSAMKSLVGDRASFIGITGTPLLKKDKENKENKENIERYLHMTCSVFGEYLHIYDYQQGVAEKVVLPMCYIPVIITQSLENLENIDIQIDDEVKNLSANSRAKMKKIWFNISKVQSSKRRLELIAFKIVVDMETDPDLAGGCTAMLACNSILEAYRYWEIFNGMGMGEMCAVITSYKPTWKEVTEGNFTEAQTDKAEQWRNCVQMISDYYHISTEEAMMPSSVARYEDDVIKSFLSVEPQEGKAKTKLLIVVDRLLTGFDTPPTSTLYNDKVMDQHTLLQALARPNRVFGKKTHGRIVDFRNLIHKLQDTLGAYTYTKGALEDFDPEDIKNMLQDNVVVAKRLFEGSKSQLDQILEPVHNRTTEGFVDFFLDKRNANPVVIKKELRRRYYKAYGDFSRAWATLARDVSISGYTQTEIANNREMLKWHMKLFNTVRNTNNENGDREVKALEPTLRHIFDVHMQAEESEITDYQGMSFEDIMKLKFEDNSMLKISDAQRAEVIQNNMRSIFVEEHERQPDKVEKFSAQLAELLEDIRLQLLSQEEILTRTLELYHDWEAQEARKSYPSWIDNQTLVSLYEHLGEEKTVEEVLTVIRANCQRDWRDNQFKQKKFKIALKKVFSDEDILMQVYNIVYENHDYR